MNTAIAVVTSDISLPFSYWLLLVAFLFTCSALGACVQTSRKDQKDNDYTRVLPPLREVEEMPPHETNAALEAPRGGQCCGCDVTMTSSIRFDFEDNKGTVVPVFSEYRPLGLNFEPQAPIRVYGFNFNSYAKTLNVKAGWTLLQVDDEDLAGLDVETCKGIINKKNKSLPVWPLTLEFRVPIAPQRGMPFTGAVTASTHFSTQPKVFHATKRPIGLEFHHRQPIVVNKVCARSFAQANGIQEKWKIVRIGEKRSDNFDYDEVMKLLREGMESLEVGKW
jgi:hypothetical protein